MSTRRSYHKVRGGCLTCKRRKVRCGLERPTCDNCNRLSRDCTYAAETAIKPALSRSPSIAPIPSAALEVELMHHYTAFTAPTVGHDQHLVSLWRDVVPKHAFKHRFLLLGLFAVAAQHKLHCGKPEFPDELFDAASYYYQEALPIYISLLDDINEDNCHALFAFSQLLAGISCSRLSLGFYDQPGSPQSLIDSLVGVFELLKGALAIAKQASTWLNAGDLRDMMNNLPVLDAPEESAAQKPCAEALAALTVRIVGDTEADATAGASTRAEILLPTIELIRTLLIRYPSSGNDGLSKIAGLPVWLDARFYRLLRARDEASLVVLAYYGAVLHRVNHPSPMC
ncbi:uncharacterized protein HMPREF1541_09580 [Cyphellophora europaea CBS 101466]|uniref:Zn(2)-C6 fungal-type domain-containing protein n=1 Tax=Cyphellophora europaea (strain CBS 101466) TaxID=1220924 RepID=W2SAM1_CYPE1|nr:uncharacterized protein HMPREF1541_09580 [Cyphellophora europaea CBS 101466]ETN45747.1 hypothetical protein HMPREF1541_09580 [Cyphellophora europaea CBS 101466]